MLFHLFHHCIAIFRRPLKTFLFQQSSALEVLCDLCAIQIYIDTDITIATSHHQNLSDSSGDSSVPATSSCKNCCRYARLCWNETGAPEESDFDLFVSLFRVSLPLRRWLQLLFDFDLTAVRLQFDRATTVRPPTSRPSAYLLWAAVLRSKYINK